MEQFPSEERLQHLGLFSLERSHTRKNMIELCKVMHDVEKVKEKISLPKYWNQESPNETESWKNQDRQK